MTSVQVQALPLQSAYPRGAVQARVPILFEVDLAQDVDQERSSCELCIVLDRSGSMAGTKMRDAKAAVAHAINNLCDGDVLHLVVYNNVASTVFTQGTRQRANDLLAALATVSAQGQTNTSAALSEANRLLQSSGTTLSNKRIFLISDGHATCGDRTVHGLRSLAQDTCQYGIIVTTFGIGEDSNEEMMKAIANSGHGPYFFLRPTILRQTIEGEMSTLFSTMGTEASIRVMSMLPVGQLLHVHRPMTGPSEDEPLSTNPDHDHEGVVWIGDLRREGHKQSLIDCQVCVPEHALDGDIVDILRYELNYRCTISNEIVRTCGTVQVVVGNSSSEVPRVRVANEMSKLNTLQEELRRLIEDREQSQAFVLRNRIMTELERLRPLDEFGFVDAALRRLRRIADRLDNGDLSHVQAGLMLGEALERHAEGDILHVSSFATGVGSPRSSFSFRDYPYDSDNLSFTPPAQHLRRRHRIRRFFRRVFPCFERPPPLSSVAEQSPSRLSLAPTMPLISPHPDLYGKGKGKGTKSLLQPPTFLLAPGFQVDTLPSEFLCPITREPMTEPVVARDGHTYEKQAIANWFAQGGVTSPKTGETLDDLTLIPNHAVRAQIMTENDRAGVLTGGGS